MSWTDDLGDAKKRRDEESKKKADALQRASVKTPSMTNWLISRLKEDAEKAATKLNAKVTVHLDADKLQIVHNTFPTFFLQIGVPVRGAAHSNPVIECLTTTKKSSSSTTKEKTFQIPVSCVGPDDVTIMSATTTRRQWSRRLNFY